ncbi:MAG: hypothetical protein IPK07_12635 [Deltaproteobacteria bacterium]|nr:hypothetical protein [Deltaproteobacteria bacterium]
MSMPLGQYLVTQGAINPSQLQLALEAQILFGGRLGYNLVDLGFMNPVTLTQHLSDYFGVPPADPKQIGHVRPDALRAVPRDVAVRYGVLPLSVDRAGVTVAMSDPNDFKAIDELAFRTGRSIKVRTMPDFLIKKGLEAHYDVPTFAEFYRPAGVEKLARIRAGVEAENANPTMERPQDVDFGDLGADPALMPEFSDLSVAVPTATASAPRTASDHKSAFARRVAAAADRREVGEALLAYGRTWFERVALLRLHGGVLRGWMADGAGLGDAAIRSTRIPVDGGLFEQALTEHALIHEPLRDHPADRKLLEALGGARPTTALVAPIFPRRGGVTVLYADNGPERPALRPDHAGRIRQLERVLRKAEVALELVVVRRWLLWS